MSSPPAQAIAGSLGEGLRGSYGDLHGREAVLEHRPGRPTDVPVVQLDVSALRTLIDFDPRDLASGLGA